LSVLSALFEAFVLLRLQFMVSMLVQQQVVLASQRASMQEPQLIASSNSMEVLQPLCLQLYS
jgi:hypothetical protein